MQRQLEVGAVALVGLDDEPLAAGPVRPGAGVGDVAADDEARRQPGLGQDQHQHRRRGRLAVRAGDGRPIGPGRRSRPACPARRSVGMPSVAGLVELDVASRDRRRRRHRVAAVDDAAVVADVDRRRPRHAADRAPAARGGRCPTRAWPISARAMAIALIPGPPTPITWRRSGADRSSGAAGRRRRPSTLGLARRRATVLHERASAHCGGPPRRLGRAARSPSEGAAVGEEPVEKKPPRPARSRLRSGSRAAP